MKKRTVEKFARFVSVGSGAVIAVAAIFFFGKGYFGLSHAENDTEGRGLTSTVISTQDITTPSPETTITPSPEIAEDIQSAPSVPDTDPNRKPAIININTASSEELQTLSGIGEAKANAIIAYREEHGGFKDISELLNVNGIGKKIFEGIRDFITVGVFTPSNDTPNNNTSTSAPKDETSQTTLININTASSKELQTLSGIGEAKANAIIAYREEHGGFKDISELLNVNGIGERIFENIRDFITVGVFTPSNDTPNNNTSTPAPKDETSQTTLININTASSEELQTLSGIGEAKANAIIAYRKEHGGFKDISELMNVSGIGEKTFENIRDRITVGVTAPNSGTPTPAPKDEATHTTPININTASSKELQTLSGIGEAKANAIIAYREEHGGFGDISELLNVSGIGEKTFERIRDFITVGSPAPNSDIPSPAPNTEPSQTTPININTASSEELQTLSGIGEAKANAIIAYREEHGGFGDISELMNVNGIGEKIFKNIQKQITV